MTEDKKYQWFYINNDLLSSLTPEEKSLVGIEILDDGFIRAWYPVSNMPEKKVDMQDLQKQIIQAASTGDQTRLAELVAQLNKR